ncbi:hypothetical protein N7520_003278 [Penicillium odoratum]|uniref:uncharacterized protein n=1 Tax=Penicillium odoratum TaxID=1167516 RepID=UPI0025466E24|nr:uncharacterized protein N7520_003278 [Penicillium odoratum]KAJ5768719.1 hypothetical protein N7520_003278 [Penicillium odoratum]
MVPPPPAWVQALKPSSPQGSDILRDERAQSGLTVDALAEFLHSKEKLEAQDRIVSILASENIFDKSQSQSMGRPERIQRALLKGKRLLQLRKQLKWSEKEYLMAIEMIGEPTPYGLHDTMFLKTLREQCTPEQRTLFLDKAEKYEIIGCYAQTELGHGSNVRGLETTATWNSNSKTFTINSPYLTASKWWAGTLGRTANHAVVMAQLHIDGKNIGPHPFVVPIRDMDTHQPFDGVYVGDIGPKFGYNTMDNGFMLFNHYQIPHVNMLARFAYVDKETNKYVQAASPTLLYGTMTWVRSNIVLDAGNILAHGVTIATRYCAIRRQFQDRDAKSGSDENQVLNYQMVQIRLLPLLAAMYALHFTGRGMMQLYEENQGRMSAGKQTGGDLLAELHAFSCGLKALASTTAGEGLETCRRACGGHGYSSFSGIGPLYADYLPTLTWEGDNYMLTQQVARYLLKSAREVLQGKVSGNDTGAILHTYVSRKEKGASFDILENDADIVAAFAWRTAHMTFETLEYRDQEKKTWNSLQVNFWRLATAHSQYLVVKTFYEALSSGRMRSTLNSPTISILRSLFRLHALHTLERNAGDFVAAGAVTVRQANLTRTKTVLQLLEDIRPHAVSLVDAWKLPDWQLNSSLGRYDGKVYEDLFRRASQENPVNELTFDPYPTNFRATKDGPLSKL